MLRRKTGRQNSLRMPPCAFAPRGGALVSNGTRLRLSAPMPLLRGATRTITEKLQAELANHFGTPLRPAPQRGAALLLLLRPRRRAEEGLQKAV